MGHLALSYMDSQEAFLCLSEVTILIMALPQPQFQQQHQPQQQSKNLRQVMLKNTKVLHQFHQNLSFLPFVINACNSEIYTQSTARFLRQWRIWIPLICKINLSMLPMFHLVSFLISLFLMLYLFFKLRSHREINEGFFYFFQLFFNIYLTNISHWFYHFYAKSSSITYNL